MLGQNTEAFHRAMRVAMSTIFINEGGKTWREPTEREARVIMAALDRSHMLTVPPEITTRNMGLRKAEEHPNAEDE